MLLTAYCQQQLASPGRPTPRLRLAITLRHVAARGDVDECAFFDEAFGGSETYSTAAASDEGNFSLKLWH